MPVYAVEERGQVLNHRLAKRLHKKEGQRLRRKKSRTLRDECLSGNRLPRICDAGCIIQVRRKNYNGARSHSQLGGLKPHELGGNDGGTLIGVSTIE